MRTVASFTMESTGDKKASYEAVQNCIANWLSTKGVIDPENRTIAYPDGRVARYDRMEALADEGNTHVLILREPVVGHQGTFVTDVGSAEWEDGIAVSITLATATETLAPQFVSVRRPRLIVDLLSLPGLWTYKGVPLASRPQRFVGSSGGDRLIEQIWNPDRSVPVIAISNEHGADLHPRLADDLASALAGLALVAKVDQDASWRLTEVKGREWSVYGAAIRLYWPNVDREGEPFLRHPLWTPRRLMEGAQDTADAADRIQRHICRKVLSASAFAVRRHHMLQRIVRSAARRRFEDQRRRAQTIEEKDRLIGQLEDQVLELSEQTERQQETIDRLEETAANYQQTILFLQRGDTPDGDDVPAEAAAPADEPETVGDAVAIARMRYQNTLVWGPAVTEGIATLREEAGPPGKLLEYFGCLDRLATALAKGPLGQDVVPWLKKQGCKCSKESETVNNSPQERKLRTWRTDEGKELFFDLHLKPADGVAPDSCARIYFEPCRRRNKVVVGWVGRHPGT